MRQVCKSKQVGDARVAPKEPAVEGLRKKGSRYSTSEIDHIRARREELISKGKNDRRISRIISEELGRSAGSVRTKIKKLKKKGIVRDNPNKKERKAFTDDEIKILVKRREELIDEGKTDGEISRIIGKGMGRAAGSVISKIKELKGKGKFRTNPYKVRNFTDEEIEKIIKRREELINVGTNNRGISRIISEELGRNAGSVRCKIKELKKKGIVRDNPNKQKIRSFTDGEVKKIIQRREELIAEGKSDQAISGIVGEELGRLASSVRTKIKKLNEKGVIRDNPNKKERKAFTDDEIKILVKRREELIDEGQSDSEISRIVGEGLERNAGSVMHKIVRLRHNELIEENPNKMKMKRGRSTGFFTKMDDDGLVEYAQNVIEEKGIRNRSELSKQDGSLYNILRTRKLLNKVFSPIEQSRDNDAVDAVFDAMIDFGDTR